jgi:hypothetical protein
MNLLTIDREFRQGKDEEMLGYFNIFLGKLYLYGLELYRLNYTLNPFLSVTLSI